MSIFFARRTITNLAALKEPYLAIKVQSLRALYILSGAFYCTMTFIHANINLTKEEIYSETSE